jgi:hypothetical protein
MNACQQKWVLDPIHQKTLAPKEQWKHLWRHDRVTNGSLQVDKNHKHKDLFLANKRVYFS